MKKQIIVLLLSFISVCSFGQIKESQEIDSVFSEWNSLEAPGCALGIIKDGQLIYSKGYGLANMEYDIPITASSVFRIGSTSKQFTAACIILLAQQGQLNLDDTLKSFFPDFPEYAEKITIRHLLNHTSGIRDYLQLSYLKGFEDDDYYDDDTIMAWLINQNELNFAPSDEYLYSNSGYWLLGQIVNKVAGMNMAEFAKKEIFEPLGMNNTHFHNDHTQIVKNRASGYVPNGEDSYQISMTTLDMIGDGGIFTTINDIKKWDDSYYSSKVLNKEFWNMMTQQGVLNNGEVIDYASGLMIGTYKGLKTIRHGGAFVGFRAELLRFPDQRLTIAIFANRGDANPSRKANQVADVLLKGEFVEVETKIVEKPKIEIPTEEFKPNQLEGNYEIQLGVSLKLSIKMDSLNVFQSWNKSSYNIIKVSGNTFQIPKNEDIRFTFSNLKDGLTQTLMISQSGRETLATRKEEIDTSNIRINDYLGSYYCKELDVTYNFEIVDGNLNVRIGSRQSVIDYAINDTDEITMEFGLLRFQRTNGSISGFTLDSGRVKNLKFEKK